MRKLTWAEFQRSGKLWFINRILSAFGYGIVVDGDTAYPACLHDLALETDEADMARAVFLQNVEVLQRVPRITDVERLSPEDKRHLARLKDFDLEYEK